MVNSVDKNVPVVFENKRKKSLDNDDVDTKKSKIIVEAIGKESKKEESVKKCTTCKRKLGVVSCYTCRCGNNFCTRHRFYDQHDCSFDYKTQAIEKLKINNPKIVNKRIRE
ncbi:AN1-type zinc finger protein 6 [Nosema granulosis]|uniref:AN1-type zinc finger protein 6 n=1 Tax=Nosema granulosis TaxID=83296 RepID=A0A9P6GZS4_9MICR|nr:AN1-type zinc finger protein 6 [Nosema granulosis]